MTGTKIANVACPVCGRYWIASVPTRCTGCGRLYRITIEELPEES